MKVARLLQALAALGFTVLLAVAWSTPSEAHAGHETSQPAAQRHEPASIDSVTINAKAERTRVDQEASASAADASIDGGAGAIPVCCGHACHAVMVHDAAVIGAAPVASAIPPSAPEPQALAGPTVHIKRPPRSPAATVG